MRQAGMSNFEIARQEENPLPATGSLQTYFGFAQSTGDVGVPILKHSRWVGTHVVFNAQTPRNEPLLNVADYRCWSVQHVFESVFNEFQHPLTYRSNKVSSPH